MSKMQKGFTEFENNSKAFVFKLPDRYRIFNRITQCRVRSFFRLSHTLQKRAAYENNS